jgi:phosphatidylethanolamine/phosphatidyl-N-methylethanolamine N-methyltransferase
MKMVTPRTKKASVSTSESRLYRTMVPTYELVFPLIFRKRILKTIRSLDLPRGAKCLEVGVGTGISLDAYPTDTEVLGIDLNPSMLQQAQRKVDQQGWKHIELREGNAEQLDFPDSSFDCVFAFHVISVVSNPRQAMEEMVRVCRPGGLLVVINHFRSSNAWVANVVDRADKVTRRLGWRTDVTCEMLVQSLPLEIQRRYKTSPLSLFTIVKARRTLPESL